MIIPLSIADGSYFESKQYRAKKAGFELRESEEHGTVWVDGNYNEFVEDEYGHLCPILEDGSVEWR